MAAALLLAVRWGWTGRSIAWAAIPSNAESRHRHTGSTQPVRSTFIQRAIIPTRSLRTTRRGTPASARRQPRRKTRRQRLLRTTTTPSSNGLRVRRRLTVRAISPSRRKWQVIRGVARGVCAVRARLYGRGCIGGVELVLVRDLLGAFYLGAVRVLIL